MSENKIHIIRGKRWKRSLTIADEKYRVISEAVLDVLGSEPIRYSDVAVGVKKRVQNFSGSIEWYTITVLRELESQGKVVRLKQDRWSILRSS
jgi:hypothetical protein